EDCHGRHAPVLHRRRLVLPAGRV
ncbi:hypothetical protein BN1723_020769, partial [Verticillium longisporum]